MQVRRVLLFFVAISLSAQSGLSPDAERGRQIYERGTSPSGGMIGALLGEDTQVAGSVLPCANCHGNNGHGKPESGIFPSDITWNALTKPYRLANANGRSHPPYTERLLKRAITMGIDPDGRTLDVAMPRFQLSQADAADLIAYIRRLGEAVDPGLTATSVRLGVILPPASQATQADRIERQTLIDYFNTVNKAGGIFSRQIELRFMETPADPLPRTDAIREFLEKERVFAVLADLTGDEAGISVAMGTTGMPAIAVQAPFPQTDLPLNRFVFYLDGSVEEEAQALLDFAAVHVPGPEKQIAIVASDDETCRETAEWLRAQLTKSGRRRAVVSGAAQEGRADIVFWLQPGMDVPPVVANAREDTTILIPGSLAGAPLTLPRLGTDRVYLALSKAEAGEDSRTTARSIWDRATTAASILTAALRIGGRELSRAALLDALESFNNVQTNLPGAVSYGPNRRIGTSGVQIMKYNAASGRLGPAANGGERH